MWRKTTVLQFLIVLFIGSSYEHVVPRVEVDTRIVGGEEIDVKDRAYQVSIQYASQHFCGGALVTPNTVLSAGHCFGVSYSTVTVFYQVRLGSNTTTGSSGQVLQINSILVHPNYSDETIDFDLSIITLRTPATLSNTVRLIHLSQNPDYSPGTYAYVSGWGYQQENATTISPHLRQAAVPIVEKSICTKAYEGLIIVTDNMICAGYQKGGKDACQGDSGGPLVLNNLLIGTVSFGLGCARESYPGVYSNVARLLDWVVENSDYVKPAKQINGTDSYGPNDTIGSGGATKSGSCRIENQVIGTLAMCIVIIFNNFY